MYFKGTRNGSVQSLHAAFDMKIMISNGIFWHACRAFVMVRILHQMTIIREISVLGSVWLRHPPAGCKSRVFDRAMKLF